MSLILLLLGCRAPAPPPTVPGDTGTTALTTATTAGTGGTGSTALSGSTALTGSTASTSDTCPVDTDTGATSSTGATASTAETSDTGATGSTGSTGDTAIELFCPPFVPPTGLTGDTGPSCGVVPEHHPVICFEPAEPTVFPPVCAPDTAAPPLCPQLDWVVTSTGTYDQRAVAVDLLPGGDLVVAGNSQQGFTFAPGQPDEAVVGAQPSVDENAWFARFTSAGEMVWAQRMTTSVEFAHVAGMEVGVDRVLVWGMYGAPSVELTGTSGSATFPESIHGDGWWATFDLDGALLTHRIVADTEVGSAIKKMTLGEDGSVYGVGAFHEELVLSLGEADETRLEGPLTWEQDYGATWLASWGPSGTLQWGRKIADPGQAVFVHKLAATPDRLEVFSNPGLDAVWGSCTEHETFLDQGQSAPGAQLNVAFDLTTGSMLGPPNVTDVGTIVRVEGTGDHVVGLGRRSGLVGSTDQFFGREVTLPTQVLFRLTSDLRPTTDMVVSPPENPAGVYHHLAASDDLVAIGGKSFVESGATFEWECGPPLVIDPYMTPSPNTQMLHYYVFSGALEPLCGGALGLSGDNLDMVIDDDGGVIIALSLSYPWTYGEGLPNEQRVTTDDTDVVLLRLSMP